MPDYRLYHFKRERIERAESMTAADDLEAVRISSDLVEGGPAELWRGARRIKTFNEPI
ncbi:MAG TPA: hypothetical protein VEA60_04335 [Allosphingosinicella sp.]|nr:hypothetical protein [Allosphingosinicella sp.]